MRKLKTFAYYFCVALVLFVVVMLGVLTGYKLGAYAIDNQKESSSASFDIPVYSCDYYNSVYVSTPFNTFVPGFTNANTATNIYNGSLTWSSLTQNADRPAISSRFLFTPVGSVGDIKVGFNSWYNAGNYATSMGTMQTSTANVDGMDYYCWIISPHVSSLSIYIVSWDNNASYKYTFVGLSVYNPNGVAFNNDVVSISIGNYSSSSNPLSSFAGYTDYNQIHDGYYNWISFVDSSGIVLTWYIPSYHTSSSDFSTRPYWYYTDTTYYMYDGSSSTTDTGYQQGYNVGYNDGYSIGELNGYQTGNSDGYNVGYNVGFNDGELHGGNYSFLGLMGAVVDAPISAFRGLFNVNILGINMADFLAGLLTLAVVLCVVKFVFLK